MGRKKKRQRRAWGKVRKTPAGRYRASYVHGPHLTRWEAPKTFDSELAADGWLAAERRLIDADIWTPPRERDAAAERERVTLRAYSQIFLDQSTLQPTTIANYEDLLSTRILRPLGDVYLGDLTADMAWDWWLTTTRTKFGRPGHTKKLTPTTNYHAWMLLANILNRAVRDKYLAVSPLNSLTAPRRPPRRRIDLLTVPEIAALYDALPPSYRIAVLILAYCQLRFAELSELRVRDILDEGGDMTLRITRSAPQIRGKLIVKDPKTIESIRDIEVPPHVAALIRAQTTGRGPSDLVVTSSRGTQLCRATFIDRYNAYLPEGKERMRPHDLRHTGAVLVAQTGATTKELMERLGHTTPAMAMGYQHVAGGRGREIANDLSERAERAMAETEEEDEAS